MSIYHKEDPHYFNLCMISILENQTIIPSEIILVKDGCLTTELDSAIESWQNKYKILKIIPLKENIGLGKALNAGLAACSYEWIFRMDTDDICAPDRFEKQIIFIKNNPDIDIFSGSIIEFEKNYLNPNDTKIKSLPTTHKDIIKFSKYRSPFNHMCVAYKKSVIESVGNYQHHPWMEDYNLWIRVLAAGYKSANLSDNLLYARAGKAMLIRRQGWDYVESEWKLLKLKRQLNFQFFPLSILIFIARSIPRLLPIKILEFIYYNLRK